MNIVMGTLLGPVTVRITQRAGLNAPPWVLLHGASGSWRTFRELQSSPAFPGGSDAVAIDLPGWGDSPGRCPFTIEEQGTVVAAILTALGYHSWHLFGHSMGGVLALEVAAAHPERTLTAVVLSPTALSAARALHRPLRHLPMAPLVGMYWVMRFLNLTGPSARPLVAFALRIRLLPLILGPFFSRPAGLPAGVFADLAGDVRPASFIAAARALHEYDVGRWQAIAARVVLLRGERDIFTPDGELSELCALIPGSHSAVLHGTGHFAHIEDADAIAELIATSGHRRLS
ncbi:alpha/beta hydrolase [Arthrobacter sp. H5]|uniref:alpha/beta fold hydrolase n=1 Tax=Arthrobacter sp. H5 TaxID=1267973 RepID=UPI0004AF9367|nr:alpha/beta hydrolase [Arthrobacter sp. H5]